MAVKLVFLGKLADLAGAPELELPAPLDWNGLIASLAQDLAAAITAPTCKLAVNGAVLADKRTVAAKDGDEIALLPPVSGG